MNPIQHITTIVVWNCPTDRYSNNTAHNKSLVQKCVPSYTSEIPTGFKLVGLTGNVFVNRSKLPWNQKKVVWFGLFWIFLFQGNSGFSRSFSHMTLRDYFTNSLKVTASATEIGHPKRNFIFQSKWSKWILSIGRVPIVTGFQGNMPGHLRWNPTKRMLLAAVQNLDRKYSGKDHQPCLSLSGLVACRSLIVC